MTVRLAWLPPAAVGAAAAVSGEMALGLLLYTRGGFLGALTLVLCVQMSALGLGLWSAPRDAAPPWPGVRRAWFLLLLCHAAAAVVAASWEGLGGLAGNWRARGMGLVLLAALPLYATGVVLGAPALSDGDPAVSPGAPAAVGAALGFALVGVGRGAFRIAAFPFVASVVAVSIGALVHSRLLHARELRWHEWATRGTARDAIEAPVPERRGAESQRPPPPPRPPSMVPPPPGPR